MRGVAWERVLFTLQIQTGLEGAVTAGPTHHLLGGDSPVLSDVPGAEAQGAVGEDEGLWMRISIWCCGGEGRLGGRLTARIFTRLTTMARMPAEIIILQNARPSDCWLMASVFRLPSTATPRIIMIAARAKKPASSPNMGYLRLKNSRKKGSSEMMRTTVPGR